MPKGCVRLLSNVAGPLLSPWGWWGVELRLAGGCVTALVVRVVCIFGSQRNVGWVDKGYLGWALTVNGLCSPPSLCLLCVAPYFTRAVGCMRRVGGGEGGAAGQPVDECACVRLLGRMKSLGLCFALSGRCLSCVALMSLTGRRAACGGWWLGWVGYCRADDPSGCVRVLLSVGRLVAVFACSACWVCPGAFNRALGCALRVGVGGCCCWACRGLLWVLNRPSPLQVSCCAF